MPNTFKDWWRNACDDDKRAYFQLLPSSLLYSCTSSTNSTSSANSSTIIPWRSVNFLDRDDDPLTPAVFEHLTNDAGLYSVADLQAFTAQAVSSHTVDGGDTVDDCLTLSINNATSNNATGNKSKAPTEVQVPAPPGSLLALMK